MTKGQEYIHLDIKQPVQVVQIGNRNHYLDANGREFATHHIGFDKEVEQNAEKVWKSLTWFDKFILWLVSDLDE
jgi:hypothetical protein